MAGASASEADGDPTQIKLAGVDEDAPHVIGALFEFPNTVDNRVIRLVGLQVRPGKRICAWVHVAGLCYHQC